MCELRTAESAHASWCGPFKAWVQPCGVKLARCSEDQCLEQDWGSKLQAVQGAQKEWQAGHAVVAWGP